jgi:energy-coupling factor transporter ATP-binding protein EcfA2
MTRRGLYPTAPKKRQLIIESHKTKIIGFAGAAQSGKRTSCEYLTGLAYHAEPYKLVNKFSMTSTGRLIVYDMKGHSFPEGKILDTITYLNDKELEMVLDIIHPHPKNISHIVSFGDALKETCAVMFGIPIALMYGSDKDKSTETRYTVNEFSNLVGTGKKFPFKDMGGSDKLTVRQVMQLVGTEIGRKISPTIWCDRLTEKIYSIIKEWSPMLILVEDVRFESEIECIQAMGGNVIGLNRSIKSSAGTKHASEQVHKLFDKCNVVIDNDEMDIHKQCNALFSIYRQIMT